MITVTRNLQEWVKNEIETMYKQGWRPGFEASPSHVIRDKMKQQGFSEAAVDHWWSDSINLEYSARRRQHFIKTWLGGDIRAYEMFNDLDTGINMPDWGTRGT